MPISEICNREVVVVQRNDTVLEAAKLMRQHHVGDVLVVEARNRVRMPVGIVTDRDLVMEILATGLNSAAITVGDIMLPDLVTVNEHTGIFDAIVYMRTKGVRRLPVVGNDGGLVGVLTLDDLLSLLAEELLALTKLVQLEQKKEATNRR